MRNPPKIAEHEALFAIEGRRSPSLVAIIRVVAVPIAAQEHGLEADTFYIREGLAPRVGALELDAMTQLPLHAHLQPVVHRKAIALDAGQTVRRKAQDRHAQPSIGHGVNRDPVYGVARA